MSDSTPIPHDTLADDMLVGADTIATFIFGYDSAPNVRRVYHFVQTGTIPMFKLRGLLCARKSAILAEIKKQELEPRFLGLV